MWYLRQLVGLCTRACSVFCRGICRRTGEGKRFGSQEVGSQEGLSYNMERKSFGDKNYD